MRNSGSCQFRITVARRTNFVINNAHAEFLSRALNCHLFVYSQRDALALCMHDIFREIYIPILSALAAKTEYRQTMFAISVTEFNIWAHINGILSSLVHLLCILLLLLFLYICIQRQTIDICSPDVCGTAALSSSLLSFN